MNQNESMNSYAERILSESDAKAAGYRAHTSAYSLGNSLVGQRDAELLRTEIAELNRLGRDIVLVTWKKPGQAKKVTIWIRQGQHAHRCATKSEDGKHEAGCTWAHNNRKL